MDNTPERKESFERIRKAIEAEYPIIFTEDEHGEMGLITDFVVVAEWMDDKGQRWLSKGNAPDSTSWRIRGLLHEALFNFDGD